MRLCNSLLKLSGSSVHRAVIPCRQSRWSITRHNGNTSVPGPGPPYVDDACTHGFRLRASIRDVCDSEVESGLVRNAQVKFSDSAALRLRRRALVYWEEGLPQKALIVKKPNVPTATLKLKEMGHWLQNRGVQVFVETNVHEKEVQDFTPFIPDDTEVDFCITLGGDGTVLYLATLFDGDEPLPPIISFSMGSLGFLTPFDAQDFRTPLQRVLSANKEPLFCTLRTRKRCEVFMDNKLVRVHNVFNECTIDRGASPSAIFVEISIDGMFITSAEGDGLIIATPSGSTAYSMSAGGPMVAPSVPCTLLTPLSPLSLSFRPLIVPETSVISVTLPYYSRSHARASFDGKHPMRVPRNTTVKFTTSLCPLPLINLGQLDSDWYEGITQKLKWNQQIRPPSLDFNNNGAGSSVDAMFGEEM